MERNSLENLKEWKDSETRKPLVIQGARQVGKTWLMREFGKKYYKKTAYVNFEQSRRLQNLFVENYDTGRIISALKIETGVKIDPEDTLIVLDEIQEASGGITSLKYFYENTPEYHVMAAGSLLGVSIHSKTSFPVGKVDFLDLRPLGFDEFIMALGEDDLLSLLHSGDWKLIKQFKSRYIHLLKQYFFIGGMPEVVLSFVNSEDYGQVRQLQQKILTAYEQDFSKHAPARVVPRIRMLWNSVPSQLAKESRKFIYSALKKGARAKDYEIALSWLVDCGLVHKISRINKPSLPLKAYEDFTAFKLFLVDTGLLSAMGGLDEKTIIDGSEIFEEFKGALTEQFVLQQLINLPDLHIHYWTAKRGRAEVDLVIQKGGDIYALEVKAMENLKAKSLKTFHQKYPNTSCIRTSMSDYRQEEWLTNVPLYAVQNVF